MARSFLSGYKTYDTSNGYGNPDEWKEAFYDRMTGKEARTILEDIPESPWQILGVPKNATGKEIKMAFRKLVMEWHPDRNPNRLEEAEAMTKRIIAAYTILTE